MSTPKPTQLLPPTLLSTLQDIQRRGSLSHATHPFASSAGPSSNALQDIIEATNRLTQSLSIYDSTNFGDAKLISRLREHANISRSLHMSDLNIQQTVDTLKKKSGVKYGEDIPLDRTVLVEWCISRFETWGRSVGMETFKDEGHEGTVTLVFGGKVLVVDIDFSVERTDPLRPSIRISNVKTSYAIPGAESNTEGSNSLDAFLCHSMQAFCIEIQRPEAELDPLEAARLGIIINDHLQYLVVLDRFAERKGEDGGLRWFVEVDALCRDVEVFASAEAKVIASSLAQERAPLDVFLLRAHALPLPYLRLPSISFLVYLSPGAYLQLLRSPAAFEQSPHLPLLDIPFTEIRKHLPRRPKGVTLASLALSSHSDVHSFSASMSMPTLTTRPAFPLVPDGAREHTFPQTADISSSPFDLEKPSWLLDFTEGGRHPGVVVSQSRMRDIELVVNPLSSMDQMNTVNIISFGTGSWVDLLLSPSNPASPERYTAVYRSPSAIHPPLQLRLTAPEEPGFILEKVPVHSIKEVWGVLEIVREQCWLNEVLLGCDWTPEGLKSTNDVPPDDTEATEADLEAVLSGTVIPRKIPVNLFLPSEHSVTSFERNPALTDVHTHRPKIVMMAPERPPISGSVGIAVTYDELKPRGVDVQVNGALGADLNQDMLEEVCRRGGTLGLPGRIWARSAGPS
ncbi:hypothetical protein BDZ89DRAFT_412713 [Hymenopellis radicata]|nr:hypothetical protein BDZ89DRAFT_412713 [Hymenopellis radicata]